jgi:hypothetical protein
MRYRIYGLVFALACGALSAIAGGYIKDRLNLALATEEPSPVVVPCLAYDENGNRTGLCKPKPERGACYRATLQGDLIGPCRE